MKKIIALCCLLFLISPVFASEWKSLFEKKYIDFETISYNDNEISFWHKTLRTDPKEKIDGQDYWFVLSKYTFNCKTQKIKTEAIGVYDLKGLPIMTHDFEEEWETIYPDTYIDAYYRMFCLVPFEDNPLLNARHP